MEINTMATLSAKAELSSWTYQEKDELSPNDILIEIKHCGICFSDIHMIENDWMVTQYPLVPGHEIIGIAKEIGSEVKHIQHGDRVGVGWQRKACLECKNCLTGNENLCRVDYEATIVKNHGGFASHIVLDSRFSFKIPETLDSKFTAPLLCGGITVYSGLRSAGMTSGQNIGIVGIGGLGHLAIQFASKLGNKVTAFTTTAEKADFAYKLGASEVIVTKKTIPTKLLQPLNIILNTVDKPLDWTSYIKLLDSDGTLCFVGNPGQLSIPIGVLLGQRRRVMASPIGGRYEIIEMLKIAENSQIGSLIEEFPLKEVNQALNIIKQNKIRFRAVLNI